MPERIDFVEVQEQDHNGDQFFYNATEADREFEEIVRWAIRAAYEREPHWSVHRLAREALRRWKGEDDG